MSTFQTGSLVQVRGRSWVVLPSTSAEWLTLKPLGGRDEEIMEISPSLENVTPAEFAMPDPGKNGDARSCALLRDAVRLGLRSTTGPFRSFGHIGVEPHPYQLVPLLMAMRQPVTRLLIADDAGIGKTVEALLIARELLDRGEIRRIAVLCPPQLAEQWQKEMEEKFHIEAEIVLPSTVTRLERGLGAGTSLFEKYPFTIVSLDFIKSDRHRLDFIRACPEFVIVDEAHSCASGSGGRGRKQRYDLVRELASRPERHMIFVTATPHSGKSDVFRSLLAFLKPEFADLPQDLAGDSNRKYREQLATCFIQRQRGNVQNYLADATSFPVRRTMEETWSATPRWQELFDRTLDLARESVSGAEAGTELQQRVCWWSALALLRAVSSSPAAAAATLTQRAPGSFEVLDEADDITDMARRMEVLDSLGGSAVMDADSTDENSLSDAIAGADISARQEGTASAIRRPARKRYRELAELALSLSGDSDPKLQGIIPRVDKLLADGYSPIIFCRFIQTAEYVARELRGRLKLRDACQVEVVTGQLAPAEREKRVLALSRADRRVLVCTDCLSEGVNLQTSFNAVIHYDLSWNPTRHEQREGRVDRFGQAMSEVRVLTWWGRDNPVDGMVLRVLLQKHIAIRQALGISVPVPGRSEEVIETLMRTELFRTRKQRATAMKPAMLPGVEEAMRQPSMKVLQLPVVDGREERVSIEALRKKLSDEWQQAAEKEARRSRAVFAHNTVNPTEVGRVLTEARDACGGAATVQDFVTTGWTILGAGKAVSGGAVSFRFDPVTREKYESVLDLPADNQSFVFRLPAQRGQTYLTRTHPLVEQLASLLVESALDEADKPLAARCGVMRTRDVATRTTLLVCRFRFLLTSARDGVKHESLAEECRALAFTSVPSRAAWLSDEDAFALYSAAPSSNMTPEQTRGTIRDIEREAGLLQQHIRKVMQDRAEALKEAHTQVRRAARLNLRCSVQPQGKPDLIGLYVFLPDRKA